MVGTPGLFEPTQQPPTTGLGGLYIILSDHRMNVTWNGNDLGTLNLGNKVVGVGTKLFLPHDRPKEDKKWSAGEALKKAGFKKPDYYVKILDSRVGSLLIKKGEFEMIEYEAALLIFKHNGTLYMGLFINDKEGSYAITEIKAPEKVPFGQEPASIEAKTSGSLSGTTYTPPSFTGIWTYPDPIAEILKSIKVEYK